MVSAIFLNTGPITAPTTRLEKSKSRSRLILQALSSSALKFQVPCNSLKGPSTICSSSLCGRVSRLRVEKVLCTPLKLMVTLPPQESGGEKVVRSVVSTSHPPENPNWLIQLFHSLMMSCWEAQTGVVKLPGQVTVSTGGVGTVKVAEQDWFCPQESEALKQAISDRRNPLVVDLAGVRYMDSSGVATLVECLRGVKTYGGALRLCGLNETLRGVFQMSRLETVFDFYEFGG